MSSRKYGEASSLTRVHSAVSPRSISRPTLISPARAASLLFERHGVLEVAEQDVDLRRDVGHLRDHFLVGEVQEVDHPGRLEGDLARRLGGVDGEGLEEVAGVAQCGSSPVGSSVAMAAGQRLSRRPERQTVAPGRCALEFAATIHRSGDRRLRETHERDRTATETLETDQAAREASGAHPYGRYLEEFEVGDVYKHWPAKTVTEADDHLFCLITMNHHPLHINDVYAAKSQQGRNVVVGPLVYSLALGMSVSDVSGKAIANLATEELKHPAPVFHGDTLFCESEVLEKRESQSKPDRGTVKVHTRVLNQDGVLVAEFKRLVLVPRRNPGDRRGRGQRRVAGLR